MVGRGVMPVDEEEVVEEVVVDGVDVVGAGVGVDSVPVVVVGGLVTGLLVDAEGVADVEDVAEFEVPEGRGREGAGRGEGAAAGAKGMTGMPEGPIIGF